MTACGVSSYNRSMMVRPTIHERITIDCDKRHPQFTAVYLRTAGRECALIETETSHARPRILQALADQGYAPQDVRWIIVTHAHLDHAGGAGGLMAACPNATLIGHPRAVSHLVAPEKLVHSAASVYGAEQFANLYGTIEPIPAQRVRAVAEGETIALGDTELRVLHVEGHANHHIALADPATDSVFTGDAFGVVYPALQSHGVFALPSTSPTNFDAQKAHASIDRIRQIGASYMCLTHFGVHSEVGAIADQLHEWLELAEKWVCDACDSGDSAEVITERLRGAWREAAERTIHARGFGFSHDEWRLLDTDFSLNAQGLAVAAMRRRTLQ